MPLIDFINTLPFQKLCSFLPMSIGTSKSKLEAGDMIDFVLRL